MLANGLSATSPPTLIVPKNKGQRNSFFDVLDARYLDPNNTECAQQLWRHDIGATNGGIQVHDH